jgi:hypothetical protein
MADDSPDERRLDLLSGELLEAVVDQLVCPHGLASMMSVCSSFHRALTFEEPSRPAGAKTLLARQSEKIERIRREAANADIHALYARAYDESEWSSLDEEPQGYATYGGPGNHTRNGLATSYDGRVMCFNVEVLRGGGRNTDVKRVDFVDAASTRRDGTYALSYVLGNAEGDWPNASYSRSHWVMIRWPKSAATHAGLQDTIARECEICVPSAPLHAQLLDLLRRPICPPSVLTSQAPEVTVVRAPKGGVAVAREGHRVWKGMWHYGEWKNGGYGAGNTTICRDAVATGGLAEGADLLAVGYSDMDGDGREEPEMNVYSIPALLRQAAAHEGGYQGAADSDSEDDD